MSIKQEAIKMVQDFIISNGKKPTKIHIPTIKEVDFYSLDENDIGGLAEKFSSKSLRQAITEKTDGKILGLEVVWDAEDFKVE